MDSQSNDKIGPQAEAEFNFQCDPNELFGLLTFPDSEGPHPAVVLLTGSDRGGVEDPYYRDHAHKMVQSGFAVLRYDSPGVGRSSGSIVGETLEYRTREAISAVKHLQSRYDIKPDLVGLWGVSQGGWICQMAAAAYDGVAFIIPVSGPAVTVVEQEVHRVEMQSRAEGFTEEEVAKAVLMRRLLADAVLSEPRYRAINKDEAGCLGTGPWDDLIEMIYTDEQIDLDEELTRMKAALAATGEKTWAKYLHIEQILPMFESLPPGAWGQVKVSYGAVMEVDPADFLTGVRVPVLVLFGEADTFLPVARCVALYEKYLGEAGNETVTIKVFQDADHTIKIDGEPAPGYYETITDWLLDL